MANTMIVFSPLQHRGQLRPVRLLLLPGHQPGRDQHPAAPREGARRTRLHTGSWHKNRYFSRPFPRLTVVFCLPTLVPRHRIRHPSSAGPGLQTFGTHEGEAQAGPEQGYHDAHARRSHLGRGGGGRFSRTRARYNPPKSALIACQLTGNMRCVMMIKN